MIIDFISYPCGYGAQISECRDGPLALKLMKFEAELLKKNIDSRWKTIKRSELEQDFADSTNKSIDLKTKIISEYCHAVNDQVHQSLKDGNFPIILGGDHSMAIGTWSAVVDYYKAANNFGLIWVDAHLDIHSKKTSHSGAIHGMPASYLIGEGNDFLSRLVGKTGKINPSHICYIGIRSFEAEEMDKIKAKNITVFPMMDVKKYGMKQIMQQAIDIVTKNTTHFGITIDVDAFDPEVAPAVGSPEPGGIMEKDTLNALTSLGLHDKIAAIEIAEYNPTRDIENKTAKLISKLLNSMFS